MVGNSIYRLLVKKGYKRIFNPTRELNLLDINSVLSWFDKFKPDVYIVLQKLVEFMLTISILQILFSKI